MAAALPMDGVRVLRVLLAKDRPRAQATVVAVHIGRWMGAAMIIIGFVLDFWLIFIGIFVILACQCRGGLGPTNPRRLLSGRWATSPPWS